MRKTGRNKRGKSVKGRNYEMTARNKTSMLPELDNDRYRSALKVEQGPLLNFVKASKRQMRDAIE